MALVEKLSEGIAYGFRDGVLSRFEAQAEVLTYPEREFLGEFQASF